MADQFNYKAIEKLLKSCGITLGDVIKYKMVYQYRYNIAPTEFNIAIDAVTKHKLLDNEVSLPYKPLPPIRIFDMDIVFVGEEHATVLRDDLL